MRHRRAGCKLKRDVGARNGPAVGHEAPNGRAIRPRARPVEEPRRPHHRPGEIARGDDPFHALHVVVGVAEHAHQDGLHHPLALDGGRQFLQGTRVHPGAGLVFAGAQILDEELAQLALGGVLVPVAGKQGVQSAAEAFEFGWGHGGALRGS